MRSLSTMKIGIRARLWVAFVLIAGMTLIASTVAWIANAESGRTIGKMVEQQVPAIVALSDLSESAIRLLSAPPSLLYSGTESQLSERWDALLQTQVVLARALDQLEAVRPDTGEVSETRTIVARLNSRLADLARAYTASLSLSETVAERTTRIESFQEEYGVYIVMSDERKGAELIFLNRINQLLSMMREGIRSQDSLRIDSLEARTLSLIEEMDAQAHVPRNANIIDVNLLDLFRRLRLLAEGEQSVFALSRNILEIQDRIATLTGEIQISSTLLQRNVGRLMATVQNNIRDSHTDITHILARSKIAFVVSSTISLLLGSLIAWLYVGRSVVRRLQHLGQSMRSIAAGDLIAPIPSDGNDEIADMANALIVFRDALVHVRYLATHDSLTGLPNRRLLEERLAEVLAEDEAMGSVVYINLRGFKEINDTFGHTIGDQVLVALADRLQWAARHKDLTGRLGGDDFVIILQGMVEKSEIDRYLVGLSAMLSAPVSIDMMEIEVEPVIGVSRFPADGVTSSQLLHNADMAMGRARSDTQSPSAFYSPDIGQRILQRKAIRKDLRNGIENGQLELLYQPKIDMHNGAIAGMEALVRWNHPERGRISPLDFIPVAEQSGLILPLGLWVLEQACRQAKDWQDAGHGPLRVAVNMSPMQVLRHDVLAAVQGALERTGLAPSLLEIEITEGVLMQEESKGMQRLKGLRDIGVHLAIDDFGTGYSSLSYLKRLPVSCLKIDQAFVRDLTSNEEDVRLNRVIIGMAHDFGLEVVAEGVETEVHAKFLRNEGCDFGQGYFFSRPLSVDGFRDLLHTSPPWRSLAPDGSPSMFEI